MKSFSKEYINSTTEPEQFFKLNNRGDYLQRCNIERLVDKNGEPTNQWVCDSRIISYDEYVEAFATLATPAQHETTHNQLDTMDAMADLYSDQMSMQEDINVTMEAIADIYSILEEGN